MTQENNIIAEYITSQCEMRNINLCGNFEDWTKVAFSLADLGEDGRSLFHRLAGLDERYRQRPRVVFGIETRQQDFFT